MTAIRTGELPANALLRRHLEQGAFTDCYFIDVLGVVSHARYVEAFYTSAVFKVERRLLAWFASRPSTDEQAHELAMGTRDQFAAWSVEARGPDQLLLCDFMGRTRSWLMSTESPEGPRYTRLYFGSAVVPHQINATGRGRLHWLFRALMGFHKVYSRVLLRAAVSRCRLTPPPSGDAP